MGRKGKNKLRLKKNEIEFNGKAINVNRFAYDIVKYIALKLDVKESCISVSKGDSNDYGCSDFYLNVSNVIIGTQISHRIMYHGYFSKSVKSNSLVPFEIIKELLETLFKKYAPHSCLSGMARVEISLSIVVELVLFLYSKDSNLHFQEQLEYWLNGFFNLAKNDFDKARGLDQIYRKGSMGSYEYTERFYDTFIKVYCIPYEKSVELHDLQKMYLREAGYPIDAIMQAGKEALKVTEVLQLENTAASKQEQSSTINFKPPLTSKRDEDSGVDLPPNPGLGVPLPHEMYDFPLVDDAPQSQKLPESSGQELPKHHRLTAREKRMNRTSSLRPSEQQGLAQHSLDTSGSKRSRKTKANVSVAKDSTPSHNFLGARPKISEKNANESSGLQTSSSSLLRNVEQGMTQSILDTSGSKLSRKTKANVSVAKDSTP